MRLVLCALLVLTAAPAALAQCDLSDNFDSGPQQTWIPTEPANLVFQDGTMGIDLLNPLDPPANVVFLGECSYWDLDVTVSMRDLSPGHDKILWFRSQGFEQPTYGVNVRSYPLNDVVLTKRTGGPGTNGILELAALPFQHNVGDWITLRVWMQGAEIVVEIEGVEAIRYFDPAPLPVGLVALAVHKGGNGAAHVQFDDFSVLALGPVPVHASSWGSVKGRF